MSPTRRAAVLVLTVASLAAAAAWLPLSELPAAVDGLGGWAPVAAVLGGGALLVALVPRTPISLACGVLFGALHGAMYALGIALVAATLTFAAGRIMGRDFIARRTGRRWDAWQGWVRREGVLAVAAVRSLPLGPYGLAGYVYGASAVRVRDYALGTLIAATPSAISYAVLGAAIAAPGEIEPLAAIPLAIGLVLSTVVLLRSRRAYRLGGQHLDRGAARETADAAQ